MSSNGQAPRKRRIQGLADYWTQKLEKIIRPDNAESNAAGFPATDEELLRLVDEIIAAFRNVDQIVETRAETRHIRFAQNLSDERAEEMAWDTIVETQVAQVGSRNTEVVRADFPDFMTRWKFVVGYFKTCKAAVYNISRPPYLERFVNNPATELDTKLSNFATNATKAHKQKIADAVKKHGSASFDEVTGELKNGEGTVIDVLVKPVKRQLADVVGPDLVEHAKIKRARRQRQARTQASNVNNASNANNASNFVYDDNGEDANNSDDGHYSEDDDDNSEVDYDNNDHADDNGHGDYNNHGDQVGGPAGVGSSNQSQHHDRGVHGGQFPDSGQVWSEEFGPHQANNALGAGLQGPLPKNPHPNTPPPIAPHHNSPHLNSPLPNNQYHGQQSVPAAGSQNGPHLAYFYPGNQHFVVDEDLYEI